MSSADPALEAIQRIVEHGGDADDVLRDVVAALHERAGYEWAAIFFVEDGDLVLGPHVGRRANDTLTGRTTVAVTWHGDRVAELAVEGGPVEDRGSLERVAALVAECCLVGWDTGGEAWEP